MAEVQEKPRTRRPQTRPVRRSDVKPTRASNRGRGLRQPTEGVLADLDRMISALIKENRDLHRQIDKPASRRSAPVLGSASAPSGPSSAESAALWTGVGRAVAGARR
jgi:hypothetical protein